MRIHHYACQGNIAGVRQELEQGVSIEAIAAHADSLEPRTPLQHALSSPLAGVDMIKFLIAQGATLSFTPPEGKSDLHWAIQSGKVEKIQVLMQLGADLTDVDEHGYDALIYAMYSSAEGTEKLALVQFLIDQGVRLNGKSSYGESALSIASHSGWFNLVQLLLDAGADRSLLGWNDLMQAIALGSLSEVEALLEQNPDLTAVDEWERTPWLLSLQVGDLAKAQRVFAAGASLSEVGRCGKFPLIYALEAGNLSLLAWLLELGSDVNATDEFETTALMRAVELNQVEAARLLLAAGANPFQATQYDDRAIRRAHSVEMVKLLVAEGENLSDIDTPVRRLFTKVESPNEGELDAIHYQADKYRRFGDRNPEAISSPFWREMVKFRGTAYAARYQYQDTEDCANAVWCFQRYGQSITLLPDGRVVEIAGEHEDYYDPDFCIYNDVVVYDGQGDFQIYAYPDTVFPPTDFHTATLVDDWIYIIGNLGYLDDRIIGETPIYRLNCTTFAIEKLITRGHSPGWISRHHAVLRDRKIHIWGGKVWTTTDELDQAELINNTAQYSLDLNEHTWFLS